MLEMKPEMDIAEAGKAIAMALAATNKFYQGADDAKSLEDFIAQGNGRS